MNTVIATTLLHPDHMMSRTKHSEDHDPPGRRARATSRNLELSMTDIETRSTFAKRKSTDAEFAINLVSPDITSDNTLYINPVLGLKVGFAAKWIYERVPTEKDGKIVEQAVCFGIILIRGQLRGRIEKAAGARVSKAEIDELVRDCYELIVAFIRARGQRQGRLEIIPHIYDVDQNQFSKFSPWSLEVGRDAVATSGAVQIV